MWNNSKSECRSQFSLLSFLVAPTFILNSCPPDLTTVFQFTAWFSVCFCQKRRYKVIFQQSAAIIIYFMWCFHCFCFLLYQELNYVPKINHCCLLFVWRTTSDHFSFGVFLRLFSLLSFRNGMCCQIFVAVLDSVFIM